MRFARPEDALLWLAAQEGGLRFDGRVPGPLSLTMWLWKGGRRLNVRVDLYDGPILERIADAAGRLATYERETEDGPGDLPRKA